FNIDLNIFHRMSKIWGAVHSYYLFLLRGISARPADTRPGLYGRRIDISSPNTNIVIYQSLYWCLG
ncbi:TPA: hypothetical protein ACIYOR_005056, partial [Escherichia coli]